MRDKTYMNEEELSFYMNWPGDRPISVGGAENANVEVHSTTGNQETYSEKEALTTTAADEAPAEEPPKRAAARPLGAAIDEEVEPLKTRFIISSDTEEDEHADAGEDSVGNNDISSDDSSDDASLGEEEYND